MKKIAIIILLVVLGITNLSYSQTIKSLSTFYTQDLPDPSQSTLVYYKDNGNYFTPFLGQWKYVNGNQTFIVTLWKKTQQPMYWQDQVHYYIDCIFGHFQMVQDYGLPTQQVLYTSQINIGNTGQSWETVIVASSISLNKLTGTINDVKGTPQNSAYPKGVHGYLTMNINSGTSPLTATWEVSLADGLFGTNQPINFTIPTNVILTKM